MSGSLTYVDSEASVPMDLDDDDAADADVATVVGGEEEVDEASSSEGEYDEEDWEITQIVRVHDGRIPPPGRVSDLMIGPYLWVHNASGFEDTAGERPSMLSFYTHHGEVPRPGTSTIWNTKGESSPWSLRQALMSRAPLPAGEFLSLTEGRPPICGVVSERDTIEYLENSYLCTMPTSPTTWGTYLLILRGACVSEPQTDLHDRLMRTWEASLETAQDRSPASLADLWRVSTQEAMREWSEDKARFDPLQQANLLQLDHVAAHDQYHLEIHAGTLPSHLVPSEG